MAAFFACLLAWCVAVDGATNEAAASDAVPKRVNSWTADRQTQASVSSDDAGNMAVVWSSRRQQGGRASVYMQRFTARGEAIGGETPLCLWTVTHQTSPAVACAGDGTVWAAWQSHSQDGDGGSIIARRFDHAGVGGDEVLVNQWPLGDQHAPVLAASRDGAGMLAWTNVLDRDGRSDVRVRGFDHTGPPMIDETPIACEPESSASSPALAARSDGGFALVFAVSDQARRPGGVRLQMLDACGQPRGAAIVLEADTSAIEPVISACSFGFIIAWLETSDSGDNLVAMMQRRDHAGAALGAPVVICDDMPRVSGIAVAELGESLIAVWNASDSQSQEIAVFARVFSHQGGPFGPAVRLEPTLGGPHQLRQASGVSRLITGIDGTVLSVWNGNGGGDDETGVYITRLGAPSLQRVDFVIDSTNRPQTGEASGRDLALAAPETDVPEPHIPPTFDRSAIEKGERIVISGVGGPGFTGILNTGWTPPDPHLAVGPEHIVVMTNGAIAAFTKTGQLQFQQPIEGPTGFWGSLTSTNLIFDPEVLFDELSGRFFAMACERPPGGTQSFLLLGVSDDANPNGAWHRYRFNVTNLMAGQVDSPNMGVDKDVVYITADRGSLTIGYGVFTYDKASLLTGAPPATQAFSSMPTTTESAGIPPVCFDDPPAMYFIEHTEGGSNTAVRLIALTNPLGTHTYTSTTLAVPAYGPPEEPPQMGTSVRPITFDARFWSVAYRNGSLWATHHINSTRVLARWYEIAMNGWPTSGQTPALVQSGQIDLGPTVRTFFSTITADADNNAAIVFARTSPTEFFSMNVAVRAHNDPPGTFRTPVSVAANNGPYTLDRWGDYAGLAVDPADGQTFWAHHEFAVGSSWRTWIAATDPGFEVPGDVNGDGDVDADDLVEVILAWGPCPPPPCPADLDDNGVVDADDLVLVILNWT